MNPELNGLITAARSAAEDAQKFFGGLNGRQLNWKPNAENWSVGQCLDHLITANETEFPIIERVVNGEHTNPLWSRVPGLTKFFGKSVLKALQPENRNKLKAPKIFRPTQSSVSVNIVNDFVAHQQKLIELMEATKDVDLEKTKIISPVASFITYTLFDAYKIFIVHERRHFRQAQNVMEKEGFPQ